MSLPGDELSVWEERAKEIYERGRQEGFKQGEFAHMNRDSKRYCTTCGVSK
jgi:flagellar biosynthesis/type III secretory pathway protein FliH